MCTDERTEKHVFMYLKGSSQLTTLLTPKYTKHSLTLLTVSVCLTALLTLDGGRDNWKIERKKKKRALSRGDNYTERNQTC